MPNFGFVKKVIGLFVLISLLISSGDFALASSSATARGPKGQTFTAAQTLGLADGQKVLVTGKGYNTKVGIYVTFCVLPKVGVRPSECGPFDVTGKNNASVWVSSNPPIYAALLVTPFGKGGSFKLRIKANRMIGSFDCKKVRCGFVTRADHTNGSYRKADVFIPVTFK